MECVVYAFARLNPQQRVYLPFSTGDRDTPTLGEPRLSWWRSCNADPASPWSSGADRHPSAALQRPGPDRGHVGERTCSRRNFCRCPPESCSTISTFQTKRTGRPAAEGVGFILVCSCCGGWPFLTLLFTFFQSLVSSATPSPVVIAPQPSVLKTSTTLSPTLPIACGDAAKVGQLVSSVYTCFET